MRTNTTTPNNAIASSASKIKSTALTETGQFPTQVLPDWTQRMITEVSGATGISENYVSGCFLGAAASLLCGKAKVSLGNGSEEPVVLWLIAADKNMPKENPIYDHIMKPVRSYGRYLTQRSARIIREQERERLVCCLNIEGLKNFEKSSVEIRNRIAELKSRLKNIPPPLVNFFIIGDTTFGVFLEAMVHNNGKMAMLDESYGLFDEMFRLYVKKNGFDHKVLRKCFSGEPIENVPFGEKGRNRMTIDYPNVCMTIATYSGVVKETYKKLASDSTDFLSYFIPFMGEMKTGKKKVSSVSEETIALYNEKCMKIATRDTCTCDVFTFAPEALDHLLELSAKNRDRFSTFSGNLAIMRSIERYQSFLSRISVILHALNNCDEAYWEKPIEKKTVEDAGKVMEEFVFPNIFNCHGLTY